MPKITRHGGPSNAASTGGPEAGSDDVARLRGGQTLQLDYFLDWLVAQRVLKPGTAQSYQTASNQILDQSVSPYASILDLDVDQVCREFERRRTDLTETTRATYQTRFRRAVEMYRQWLDDPASVQAPATRDRINNPVDALAETSLWLRLHGQGHTDIRNENLRLSKLFADESRIVVLDACHSSSGSSPDLVSYPFPLDDGRLARLELPQPLSRADAERLSQFVLALATEPLAPMTHSAPDFQFVDADGNRMVGEVKGKHRSPHAPPLSEDDEDRVETEVRLFIDPNVLRHRASRKEQ